MKKGKNFEESLTNYIKLAEDLTKERPHSKGRRTKLREGSRGTRYVKIVEKSGSVFAFIDLKTGDILRPATFNRPAKHPRGNIFDPNPLTGTGPYGPKELPNWRNGYGRR